MADEPTTETDETTEQSPEDQESGEGAQTPDGADAAESDESTNETEGEETDEDSKLDLDSAKQALAKVRKEAANWRTKYRDLEKKAGEAKTPEEIEALVKEVQETAAAEARALLVENVALAHGLPADLADALKGETREELEAHAKTLQKYAPSPQGGDDPEVAGGLDPTGEPVAYDPVKRARELRASRNRGF